MSSRAAGWFIQSTLQWLSACIRVSPAKNRRMRTIRIIGRIWMLSRMAFVPAFGKERQCTQMTSPSGHRSPPARYPVALCTAFDLQPATHPGRATMSHIIVGSSAGKSVYAELECQLFVKFVSQPKLSRLSLPNGCFLSAAPGRRRCLSARRRTRVLGIRLAGVWSFAARSHSQSCLHPLHQPSPASHAIG